MAVLAPAAGLTFALPVVAGQWGEGRLFELAVFAAPAVEPDVGRTAITHRLTRDAGPDPWQRSAARFRDFLTAFDAVGLAFAGRHAGARPFHLVGDRVVDLVLHRPVWSPPVCHCWCPVCLSSEGVQMVIGAWVSNAVRAGREVQTFSSVGLRQIETEVANFAERSEAVNNATDASCSRWCSAITPLAED